MTTKFKLYNKMVALDRIAKHIGFYKPQSTEPKLVYQYISIEGLTEDDKFDDEHLRNEIMQREKADTERLEWEKWGATKKTQESRSENQDEGQEDGKTERDGGELEYENRYRNTLLERE